MKKYFYFAAAAIVALASCQKNQVITPADDETPVAVSMKANAPISGVATKAAVEAWDDTPIVGFATKTLDGTTTQVYFEKDLVVGSDGSIDLKNDDDIPYFYAERAVYDFYAYYSGDATFVKTTDGVYNVTFSGADDIMYAMADKSQDIPDPNPDGVTEADLYSAWAARRGVQPTLVFQHALTKFDFNIIGAADGQSTKVRIDKIGIQSKNTGVMTVVGATQSFVVADVNTPSDADWLWLKDESKATDQSVLEVSVLEGDQELPYSLMVAPGMTTVNVEVYMSQDVNGTYVAIPEPYKIPVNIAEVNFASAEVPRDAFSAGYAYTLNITVYGPQEIKIDAVLTNWKDGGSHEFNPDEDYRPGTGSIPSTPVAVTETAVLGADVTEEDYDAFYDGSNAPEYEDAVASGTLPWVGFKFAAKAADAVFYVKCTYDGTPVTFAERSWYTKVDANTIKVPVPAGCTVVSFEAAAEMGLSSLDPSKEVVFTVTE